MKSEHQLEEWTWCKFTTKEDCKKAFDLASKLRIASPIFRWIDDIALFYGTTSVIPHNDLEDLNRTSREIPCEEFISRMSNSYGRTFEEAVEKLESEGWKDLKPTNLLGYIINYKTGYGLSLTSGNGWVVDFPSKSLNKEDFASAITNLEQTINACNLLNNSKK